jgi:serine/threonine protein kinase
MNAATRSCPSCGRVYPAAAFFCGADGTITIQDQDPGDFDPRLGTQLGNYVVVARVADGAMGRVFEGRHAQTKARVAIKMLQGAVASDAIGAERFRREFETAAGLGHAHIVHMIEFGVTPQGAAFLVMEYLEGQELARVLGRGQPLPWARVVRIVCQVALALEHAHAFGFVHRDLKPDNIFLCHGSDGDDVRVVDFGSVKLQLERGPSLTAIGTTVGSPSYMSPEQAMGEPDIDHASDVFALGVILYEMLTDQLAFEAPNIAKIMLRILHDEPVPPSAVRSTVPASLDTVVQRALMKRKADRYASARELGDAVVRGFGLRGPIELWAARSTLEIETALASSMPLSALSLSDGRPTMPAPSASGSASGSAHAHGRGSAAPQLGLATVDRLEARRPRKHLAVGALMLVLLGLLIVGGALMLILR